MSHFSWKFSDVLVSFALGIVIAAASCAQLIASRNSNIEKELAPYKDTVICSMVGHAFILEIHKTASTHSYLLPTRNKEFDYLCAKTEAGVEFDTTMNRIKKIIAD